LIHSYNWTLLDNNGATLFTSKNPSISYSFPDTGIYRIKLAINEGEQCNDSISSIARVYPGFKPDFTISGICFSKPTSFKDASTSQYGVVSSWSWDFGEISSSDDVSDQKNPVYTYPSQGDKQIQLVASDTKGCRDTVYKSISIFDKPPITLAFRDTTICISDHVQLHVSGSGAFNWTGSNISGVDSPDPVVQPLVSTTYVVHENDQGCLNADSVHIKVVDHVNLTMMPDTVICQGDAVQMHISSDALQ
jgi:PKD repeat protein